MGPRAFQGAHRIYLEQTRIRSMFLTFLGTSCWQTTLPPPFKNNQLAHRSTSRWDLRLSQNSKQCGFEPAGGTDETIQHKLLRIHSSDAARQQLPPPSYLDFFYFFFSSHNTPSNSSPFFPPPGDADGTIVSVSGDD